MEVVHPTTENKRMPTEPQPLRPITGKFHFRSLRMIGSPGRALLHEIGRRMPQLRRVSGYLGPPGLVAESARPTERKWLFHHLLTCLLTVDSGNWSQVADF